MSFDKQDSRKGLSCYTLEKGPIPIPGTAEKFGTTFHRTNQDVHNLKLKDFIFQELPYTLFSNNTLL